MRFLAPQTRPKKGTDRQDTGPGNHTTTRVPFRSLGGVLPCLRRTYFGSDLLREPQESISETRERVSGPWIAGDIRPWLGDTVRGFQLGRRGRK